ncbi:LysR family transcriptional regulator [Streptomyces sp. NPDC101776]|uniref:LysR family transcriptional regulator n=1 Tax=Streptomyces sp. NPDC101776 TaxID=3366146 RepID=UPI0038258971
MVPNFSLRQLGYLVAVADSGSMTAAAEAEHVSQAAISAGINDLERRLGVRLLARHPGHGVSLTEAGLGILADARRVLAAASGVLSQARAPGSDLRGSLTLGCFTTMAPLYIPALYDAFASQHPGLELTVVEGAQEDLRRALMNGTCEIALTYANRLGPGVAMETIRTLRPYVLLAASHALADRESVTLHDLADEPLVQFSLHPSPNDIEELLRHAAVTPKVVHSSPSIEVVRSLVARGLGYSPMLQRWPMNVSLEGLPLACVPLESTVPDYRVVVAWPQNDHLSRRAAAVVSFLRTHATEHPIQAEAG